MRWSDLPILAAPSHPYAARRPQSAMRWHECQRGTHECVLHALFPTPSVAGRRFIEHGGLLAPEGCKTETPEERSLARHREQFSNAAFFRALDTTTHEVRGDAQILKIGMDREAANFGHSLRIDLESTAAN